MPKITAGLQSPSKSKRQLNRFLRGESMRGQFSKITGWAIFGPLSVRLFSIPKFLQINAGHWCSPTQPQLLLHANKPGRKVLRNKLLPVYPFSWATSFAGYFSVWRIQSREYVPWQRFWPVHINNGYLDNALCKSSTEISNLQHGVQSWQEQEKCSVILFMMIQCIYGLSLFKRKHGCDKLI